MKPGRKPLRNFTDLNVWKFGHQLALEVYKVTADFPSEERFGLVSQMRRSASSITANIAEGFGRQGKSEKGQFYIVSRGSVVELQDQLLLARDLGFMSSDVYNGIWEQSVIVHKLINGLIRSNRDA